MLFLRIPAVFALLATIPASLAAATLSQRQSTTDVNTPLTYPAGTTWHAGDSATVTWDATHIPTNVSYIGMLWLTKDGTIPQGSIEPFLSNFDMLIGNVKVIIPDVQTGDDYAWVLEGTSPETSILLTNVGPNFSIVNSGASTSSFIEGSTLTSATTLISSTGSGSGGGGGATTTMSSTAGASTTTTGQSSSTGATTSVTSTNSGGATSSKSTVTSPASSSTGTTKSSTSTSSTSSTTTSSTARTSRSLDGGISIVGLFALTSLFFAGALF